MESTLDLSAQQCFTSSILQKKKKNTQFMNQDSANEYVIVL